MTAEAWITGEAPNQKINFRLPTGPKGNQGDKGPKGDQGNQGLPGVNAVPADEAVGTYATTPGTATHTAINATTASKFAQGAALTRAAGAWTIGLGDSLTDIAAKDRSYFEQTCLLSGQRVARLGNAGISGNTVEQMLARLQTDVIDKRPDRVLFKGGTNNMEDDVEYASAQPAYQEILDTLLAEGIAVTCVSIPPRNDTTAIKDRGKAWNAWCKDQAESRGLLFIDTYALFADASGGFLDPAHTTDGIHLTAAGAILEAKSVAAALAPYYPPVSPIQPAQENDATNLLTNYQMTGGDKPDSYTLSGTSLSTLRAVDSSRRGVVYKVTKAGATSGSMWQDIDKSRWAIGDTLGFSIRVRLPEAYRGLTVYLAAFDAANAVLTIARGADIWDGSNTDWSTFGGRITVPAGTSYVRFMMANYPSGALDGSFYIAEPAVRRVARTLETTAAPGTALSAIYAANPTGPIHRWMPDGQGESAGVAVPALIDRHGVQNLTAMASGTRTMRSDALGKYVENSSVDNSGFSSPTIIPAGAKTFSLVVKVDPAVSNTYLAQIGGFNVNKIATDWYVYASGPGGVNVMAPTSTGAWEHLLFVWDGVKGTFYHNGTAIASALSQEGAVAPTLLLKGAGQALLREAVVYGFAFTASQVTNHRNALKAKWTDLP